jgi:hypothetical protein
MVPLMTTSINTAEGPCVAWGAEAIVEVGGHVVTVTRTVIVESDRTNDPGSGVVVIEIKRSTDGANAPERVEGSCDCPNEVNGDLTNVSVSVRFVVLAIGGNNRDMSFRGGRR